MDFVRSRGGDVSRYNLASEPLAFADNEAVKAFLHIAGSAGLPLVLVDGVTAMTGRYPDRAQLAAWAGVEAPVTYRIGDARYHRQRPLPGAAAAAATARAPPAAAERPSMTQMKFLDGAPRFLFFTGKGGVGKTSIACATAITLARQGKKVLLVSTDPASNVGQVFGIAHRQHHHRRSPPSAGLSALEIDPEQAAEAYRERIVGPVRGLLPDAEVASITEQLSGSCTTEIASFNEFTELLTDSDGQIGRFDHVLFDTAPTGHTIRLLQLPGSWTDFLNDGKGDASCLGPLSGLEKQRTVYAAAVAALADPTRTRLVLVARAQTSTLAEIDAHPPGTRRDRPDPSVRGHQRSPAHSRRRQRSTGGRDLPARAARDRIPARRTPCTAARSGRPQGRQHRRHRRTRIVIHPRPPATSG